VLIAFLPQNSVFLYLLCTCPDITLYAPGNALGYVRMVRSASMYYCSEAVKYLPDFDDIISFEDCAGLGMRSDPDADGGGTALFMCSCGCTSCCEVGSYLCGD
jgi:hypothetical protein